MSVDVTRRGRCTVIATGLAVDDAADRIRRGCARMVRRAANEVDPTDVGVFFELLRGSVEYGRGVGIRTMVRARGEVRPSGGGSEVLIRFRPHWEAATWMMFTGGLALVGAVALLTSIVAGSGPYLSPIGGVMLFGGITAWRLRQLRVARRELERDLQMWLTA